MAKKKTTKKKAGKAASQEMLLVGSKVKAEIKEAGFNSAGDALEGLNTWVHWLIAQATARAHANGRKTVRSSDFMA
ncbi:MAG: hypothetical protein AAGA56_16080 [Myxococcota bacterium]